MKRAAMVADVRDWAFDVNLRDFSAYVTGWECEHFYVGEWQKGDGWRQLWAERWNRLGDEYDAIFTPYHRWGIPAGALPKAKHLGSLRSQWFDPQNQVPPTQADIDLVNRHAGFHVVNHEVYKALAPHCPGVVYLTNPVNMRRFSEPTRVRDTVIFEWNGNANHAHRDVKGLHGIITPAATKVGARVEIAEYNTVRIPHEEMPAFYRRANVALCASEYEGSSNSVQEAMAVGLALITTDCGNAREMQDSQVKHFGESGIVIVPRSSQYFAMAMREMIDKGPAHALRLGELNRAEIDARWSWHAWASRYQDFLGMTTRAGDVPA